MHRIYQGMSWPVRQFAIGSETVRLWLFYAVTTGFITVMAFSSVFGFISNDRREVSLVEYRLFTENTHILQKALIDAETGIRGFVLAGRAEYLEPYFHGLQVIDERGPGLLEGIDDHAVRTGLSTDPHAATSHVSRLREIWLDVVALTERHEPALALDVLEKQHQKRIMDELRGFVGADLDNRTAESSGADRRLAHVREILLVVNLSGALIAVLALTYAFRRSVRETRHRQAASLESERTALRIRQLFGMTSMLQNAPDRQDANEVLVATATRLLPDHDGLLYIFNNSQDRLDLSVAWGQAADRSPPDHFLPSACWAMKSGKPHLNLDGPDTLRCRHHAAGEPASLEIPMVAGGQVYGLLVIGAGSHADVGDALRRAKPVATALADAMSLALSGMALRDQLRNQAIRDPLTGLYNRRFLDEMLDRLGLEARRRRTPLAAIMIDLDHFKRLNDQHGHATGDAVLRAVSGAIVAVLRGTDVACRYGGEELVVLLPDCSLEMAVAKAEQLRVAIADLASGPGVTASLGVALFSESSAGVAEMLASADAALYRAKQNGRNRVEHAAQTAPVTPPYRVIQAKA